MPDASSFIQIYIAQSVLEASLIRKTLNEHGIQCLVVGEDLEAGQGSGLEDNAILVPVEKREEAIKLLHTAWEFFEAVNDESEGTDQ